MTTGGSSSPNRTKRRLTDELWTDEEIYQYSIRPKIQLNVKTHFAIKRLNRIVDRIVGGSTKSW